VVRLAVLFRYPRIGLDLDSLWFGPSARLVFWFALSLITLDWFDSGFDPRM
jgi:hypothetical protein